MASSSHQVNVGALVDPFASLSKGTASLADALSKTAQARRQGYLDTYGIQKDNLRLKKEQVADDVTQQVKDNLDAEVNPAINDAYAGLTELDPEYKAALGAADRDSNGNLYSDVEKQYLQAQEANKAEAVALEGETVTGYDSNGNAIPFMESAAGLEQKKKSDDLNTRYSDYLARRDQELATTNATAIAQQNAGYDPTKLKKRLYNALKAKGISSTEAEAMATTEASKYQSAPLTDRQKTIQDAQIKMELDLTAQEAKALSAQRKGIKGTYIDPVTGARVTSSRGGASKTGTTSADIEDGRKQIMDLYDRVGWGGLDNKGIVDQIYYPLVQEYAGVLAPQDIINMINTFHDDGVFTDQIKSNVGKGDVGALLKEQIQKRAAIQTGNAGISQGEYDTQLAALKARGNNAITDIQAKFQGAGNQTTGLSNILRGVNRINNVKVDHRRKGNGSLEATLNPDGSSKKVKTPTVPVKIKPKTNIPVEKVKSSKNTDTPIKERQADLNKALENSVKADNAAKKKAPYLKERHLRRLADAAKKKLDLARLDTPEAAFEDYDNQIKAESAILKKATSSGDIDTIRKSDKRLSELLKNKPTPITTTTASHAVKGAEYLQKGAPKGTPEYKRDTEAFNRLAHKEGGPKSDGTGWHRDQFKIKTTNSGIIIDEKAPTEDGRAAYTNNLRIAKKANVKLGENMSIADQMKFHRYYKADTDARAVKFNPIYTKLDENNKDLIRDRYFNAGTGKGKKPHGWAKTMNSLYKYQTDKSDTTRLKAIRSLRTLSGGKPSKGIANRILEDLVRMGIVKDNEKDRKIAHDLLMKK